MSTSRITITLDEGLLKRLDHLVLATPYSSRSRTIQEAVEDKLRKANKDDFERELVKLDPRFEQEMADEGLCEVCRNSPNTERRYCLGGPEFY